MIRIFIIVALVILFVGLVCCQKEAITPAADKPLFDSIPSSVNVTPLISEASGIADSKTNSGHLWVQEDGGNPTQLYLLKHNGSVQKKIYIDGIVNRDWEEMALAGTDIYLGEIGDNNEVYSDYAFYKFPEPQSSVDTIKSFETFRFTYVDGSHDAEAFFVEQATNNIYIFTKRDAPSRIYKLTAPLSSSGNNIAQLVGQLSYTGVTGAAISPDGKEMIIKTYFALGYYKGQGTETIEATLQKSPILIPYQAEPQGEAVCFSAGNTGYFTLSEKGFANEVKLYFYKRN